MQNDYSYIHDLFMQMHEPPPSSPFPNLEMALGTNTSPLPIYDLTADGSSFTPSPNLPTTNQPQPHVQPNRDTKSRYLGGVFDMTTSEAEIDEQIAPPIPCTMRKRKYSAMWRWKRCASSRGTLVSDDTSTLIPSPTPPPQSSGNSTKGRQHVSDFPPGEYSTASTVDDVATEEVNPSRSLSDKKQNHSEIEKRRRDKMNNYIMELSTLIPMCGSTRKLDKLTVLRMTVQHLSTITGSLISRPLNPRPSFLSEQELNGLVLQAAHDCFLFVVGCDRGRLIYVSRSVKKMLNYEQKELLDQSLFDILHPKDVAKVKEQLSSSDTVPRDRLIDPKTMLPVKSDVPPGTSRFCPGARRSFFCRIKSRPLHEPDDLSPVKDEVDPNTKMRKKVNDKKYCVIQCTGYLKAWAKGDLDVPDDGETGNRTCLVAVGRALSDPAPSAAPYQRGAGPKMRQMQFVSRHTPDGKFIFVDQRVTLVLGFLPQELLGSSLYEYIDGQEITSVARIHKTALKNQTAMHTEAYSFRRKNGTCARLTTHFKPFKNPWTQELECLVAKHTVVGDGEPPPPPEPAYETQNQTLPSPLLSMFESWCGGALMGDEAVVPEADQEMQQLIDSQVESHKIGSAIAQEVLHRPTVDFTPDLPSDILPDIIFDDQEVDWQSSLENILDMDDGNYDEVHTEVSLSTAGTASPTISVGNLILDTPLPPTPTTLSSPPSPPSPPPTTECTDENDDNDGNGEAAMAVFMNFFEADAGLGGSVSLAGLPWPLP